jgi:hypothetical protein
MTTPAAAAPAAAPPAPAPGEPITASWRDALPEEHRGAETLKKFEGKDWTEVGPKLAVSYINLEKMPRGVSTPKEGAPQAEWDAYYEKLGRPKTAEEYSVDVKVPEGMPWNKAAEGNILKHMHQAGLTKKQAETVINGYLQEAARGEMFIKQEKAKSREEAEIAMKREWGGLADMNIALVQRGVHEFGDDVGFKDWLDETGAGNDPRFFKFMHRVLSPMMESNLIKGEGLGMKRSEAQAEIERLMRDPKWIKGDKEILGRIAELYPIANGE